MRNIIYIQKTFIQSTSWQWHSRQYNIIIILWCHTQLKCPAPIQRSYKSRTNIYTFWDWKGLTTTHLTTILKLYTRIQDKDCATSSIQFINTFRYIHCCNSSYYTLHKLTVQGLLGTAVSLSNAPYMANIEWGMYGTQCLEPLSSPTVSHMLHIMVLL